jgi:hypothetical protein
VTKEVQNPHKIDIMQKKICVILKKHAFFGPQGASFHEKKKQIYKNGKSKKFTIRDPARKSFLRVLLFFDFWLVNFWTPISWENALGFFAFF